MVGNTKIRRVISTAVAAMMLVSSSFTAFAQTDELRSAELSAVDAADPMLPGGAETAGKRTESSYRSFYAKYSGKKGAETEISVTADAIRNDSDFMVYDGTDLSFGEIGGASGVLCWSNQVGGFEFGLDIDTEGVYSVMFEYYVPEESNTNEVEFELDVNGECQYPTATRITLPKVWVNEANEGGTGIDMDTRGNDIRPGQQPVAKWQTMPLKDIDGLYAEPLIFYFEKGRNIISIKSEKAQFAIKQITLYQYHAPGSYKIPSSSELLRNKDQRIVLEGELAAEKSARTLFPTSDMHSYITSCVNGASPTKTRYNSIGKENWTHSTQSATWNIEVPVDGYYKIGIRAKQDSMRGMYSNRRLYIDGVVPDDRSEQIKFFYDTEWSVVVPSVSDDENADPIYYYLTAGSHTLTLEAVPGEIGQIIGELDDLTYDISSYYRRIRQITGPNPDQYTNYNINMTIPEIVPDFERFSQTLRDRKNKIESLSNQGGSEAVQLEKMAIILDECIEKPDRIPELMIQIKENVTSMSAWVSTYRQQPLEIDMIEICSPDQEFTPADSNFFESFKFGFDAFIGSFFEDYNSLTDLGGDNDVMTCWIALGRDNATVVTNLVNNEFNIRDDVNSKVNMKLVQGGILEATFAGKGPDIVLFVGGDFVVQLSSRGVLEDLTQFPDYNEVIQRFSPDASTLYKFDGGVYGLPVTQDFPMLFYRSDVLSELDIDPETDLATWDGLMNVLPTLQRNYMEVGLILPPVMGTTGVTSVSPITEAGNTFAMLMLQKGLNFYTDDLTKTTFDSPDAVDAFVQWTEFYTKYSFPQIYDALTRFRQGDMPVVLQNYTFYNMLYATAPEIQGCWDFMHVPGTPSSDGQVTLPDGSRINISANSGGLAAIIFNTCPDKEAAWEFVKWFTSDETQTTYGNDIESVLGTIGRYNTANLNALQNLSWTKTQVDKLTEQLTAQVEIPIIPASYGVTRNINNAFRETVNRYENPRDTLFWYDKDINEEIRRKNNDLALYDDN